MKLYAGFTPNSVKVKAALAELGTDYELQPIVIAKGEHRSEAFTRINPHQKVPVLEVDGVPIAESNAIVQYLGRTHAGSLWPPEAIEDARLSRWLFFDSAHLSAYTGALWWTDVLAPKRGVPATPESRVEHAMNELARSLKVLDGALQGREYLHESGFTLADCSLGAALSLLIHTRLDLKGQWPRLFEYTERVRGRESWARAEGDRCLHWMD